MERGYSRNSLEFRGNTCKYNEKRTWLSFFYFFFSKNMVTMNEKHENSLNEIYR